MAFCLAAKTPLFLRYYTFFKSLTSGISKAKGFSDRLNHDRDVSSKCVAIHPRDRPLPERPG